MDNAVLLSPSDVVVIRRYVQTKYAPLPKARQAEIVAEAIRGTIDRRLPELEEKLKSRITQELIHRCLVTEGRDVIPEDVLDVCADIRIEEPMDLERLSEWLEERDSGRWTREQIATRINRGNRKSANAANAEEGAEPDKLTLKVLPLTESVAVTDAARADAPGLTVAVPMPAQRSWRRNALWGVLSIVLAAGMALWLLTGTDQATIDSNRGEATLPSPSPNALQEATAGGMPAELRYKEFEPEGVLAYLHGRESLLAEEPYFTAIIESAREFDVNPLFLFAITGQEQGFVPKSNKNAKLIANNPFNVFHSWQDYNTDIHDSSRIAAKFIAKLGQSIPEGEEAIAWMNIKYAEDKGWSTGVRQLFDKLTSLSK